jgi:Zn-dependent protease
VSAETRSGSGFGASSLPLFRVGGIQVRLHRSWFLIFALILVSLSWGYLPRATPDQPGVAYWVAGLAGTLLFFLSLLVHELSHSFVARAAGIQVPAITLFLFGGVSEMDKEPDSPGTELRVAIVGPLSSLSLALAFWLIRGAIPPGLELTHTVVGYLAFLNAALGVFNLLPGYPLDGGRVLRAIVWWRTGSLRRATRIAADAGKGLAFGLMLLGGMQIFSGALVGGLWMIFIGIFLRSMAESGYQTQLLLETFEQVTVGDVATVELVSVDPSLPVRKLVEDYVLGRGFRAFPVVGTSGVEGIISIANLAGLPEREWDSIRVRDRMSPLEPSMQIRPDTPVREAMQRLSLAPGRRLLVMEGDQLLGMLTPNALARFVEIRRLLDLVREPAA